jgi:predicted nucleic acid-binding protein
VLGELEYGILLLPPGRRRVRLEQWFISGAKRLRILDFDAPTASVWARLLARLKSKGLAMPVKDSLIAATALAHGLSVATRNVHDFRNAGVKVENPFTA